MTQTDHPGVRYRQYGCGLVLSPTWLWNFETREKPIRALVNALLTEVNDELRWEIWATRHYRSEGD